MIKAGACIEASFKRDKGEVGMDEYQVRIWQGWHHHMALSMKPPRSKLRGIIRKGIVCETPRFLTLFPLQGNLGASSEESPD